MFRFRRKEDSKTHSRIPRKPYKNSEILKPRQIGGVEQVLSTWVEQLVFLDRLEGFNT